MFAYINIFKPKIHRVNIDDLNMDDAGWGHVTINDVLKNPKKYKDDYDRIQNADLHYPIILDNKMHRYDGLHRLVKAKITGKKYIRAYIFPVKIMKKFIVEDTDMDVDVAIQLFVRRFL